jgi:hypothetical protein
MLMGAVHFVLPVPRLWETHVEGLDPPVAAIAGGMAVCWGLGTTSAVLLPFPDPAAWWPLPVPAVVGLLHLHLPDRWRRTRGGPR